LFYPFSLSHSFSHLILSPGKAGFAGRSAGKYRVVTSYRDHIISRVCSLIIRRLFVDYSIIYE